MPKGWTSQHSHLHGCLQQPGCGGPEQLHRPKVAPFHRESTNKGNCRLRTLLIMFSYFFNTSPLSALSSLHSVLANYTCKANRKLNIPPSRDCRGSGALVERHGSEVGHRSLLSSSQPSSLPLLDREPQNQALQGWVPLLTAQQRCRVMGKGDALRKGLSSSTSTLGGGTELSVPRPSLTGSLDHVCKTPLFSSVSEPTCSCHRCSGVLLSNPPCVSYSVALELLSKLHQTI